jgi:acyl carrier protein
MTREEIISQLTPIARAMLKDENLELTDDLSAANVPTWTSLSFMMLLTEIENHFGFKFKMMEILKLQNMGAIIDSIQTHVG